MYNLSRVLARVNTELGVTSTIRTNTEYLSYRGIVFCTITLDDRVRWMSKLGLNVPVTDLESIVPDVDYSYITEHEKLKQLMAAYVRPVYKKFTDTRRNSSTEYAPKLPTLLDDISDDDMVKYVASMVLYIDKELSPSPNGWNLYHRMLALHQQMRSRLSDEECLRRAEWHIIDLLFDTLLTKTAAINLPNGSECQAFRIEGESGIGCGERCYAVLVKHKKVKENRHACRYFLVRGEICMTYPDGDGSHKWSLKVHHIEELTESTFDALDNLRTIAGEHSIPCANGKEAHLTSLFTASELKLYELECEKFDEKCAEIAATARDWNPDFYSVPKWRLAGNRVEGNARGIIGKVSFPRTWLLMQQDELERIIKEKMAEKAKKIAAQKKQEQEEEEAEERRQLRKLVEKYGVPEDYVRPSK